jgi:ubiquinone/menaquinone biosynthesis C-methylase UbiE
MAGMGEERRRPPAYNRHMIAFVYDTFLALGERRGMGSHRRELLSGVRGRVLELGAGTGLNLPYYPADVELVVAEPDPGMRAKLERRVARSRRSATVAEAPAEALPFPDGSFDTVVSTMVLCTVGDVRASVREVRRVLAPGGRLAFIEHVRASSSRLAAWQDRLAAPWRVVGRGCRCNQATLELLEREGLRLEQVSRARWRGMPAIVHPLVVGEAS